MVPVWVADFAMTIGWSWRWRQKGVWKCCILWLVASPFPVWWLLHGFTFTWWFATVYMLCGWFSSYGNKYRLWMMCFWWVSAGGGGVFVVLVKRTDVFRFNCTSWFWFSWSFAGERVFLVFLDDTCSFQQRFKLQVMFLETLICFGWDLNSFWVVSMFRSAAKETLAFGHVLETFCFRNAFLKREVTPTRQQRM